MREAAISAGRLYSNGLSTREVAVEMGISKSTAARLVRESGVQFDGASRIAQKLTGRPGNRKGAKHTEDALRKMSEAGKGVARSTGTRRTPEQKEKMRQAALLRIARNPESLTWLQHGAARAMEKTKLSKVEAEARSKVRSACKRMLRRILAAAGAKKLRPTEALLGYSGEELRTHIEAQFADGMGWDKRDSFHIDHITPVAHFFRIGVFDPKVINALSNLQVLTPQENRKKSNRVITISAAGTVLGVQRV